ncbi:MAG: hypothetical protein MJZ41_17205 [Bacteroidaceae bacterium]|nr:hypothetical protein [Bacteroidaceae bacterium]
MDICDTFNKKKFPKWFDFPGWHPQCRCVAVPITPKDSEMDEYLRKMVNGEDLSNWKWSGEVTELPAEFTGWMEENAGRLQKMQAKGNLPYFVRNNFGEEQFIRKTLTKNEGGGSRYTSRAQAMSEAKKEYSNTNFTSDELNERVQVLQEEIEKYTPEQRKMFREIEQQTGVRREMSMPIGLADSLHALYCVRYICFHFLEILP